MELYIAGGCSEHGRNCFLVRDGNFSFLVDAGLMKENPANPFPALADSEIRNLSYLFLTHCHVDHIGALLFLYEHGFQGRVIASRHTFADMPGIIRNPLELEELGKPCKKIKLDKKISFSYGRSGHCLGSVWFLFFLGKRKILFSGDYCEHSLAYRCDPIRNIRADAAVLDCAYGNEQTDSKDHLLAISDCIAKAGNRSQVMFFPVPVHGRGFDVMALLNRSQVPVYAGENLLKELSAEKDDPFWLKKSFRKAEISDKLKLFDGKPLKEGPAGIAVSDSQLSKEADRSFASELFAAGGLNVLTGKQDPASFAKKMLLEGKAVFCRISVHQNVKEMKKLIKKNSFSCVIPFHCREELHFKNKKILVLHVRDRVRF